MRNDSAPEAQGDLGVEGRPEGSVVGVLVAPTITSDVAIAGDVDI